MYVFFLLLVIYSLYIERICISLYIERICILAAKLTFFFSISYSSFPFLHHNSIALSFFLPLILCYVYFFIRLSYPSYFAYTAYLAYHAYLAYTAYLAYLSYHAYLSYLSYLAYPAYPAYPPYNCLSSTKSLVTTNKC